MFRVRVSVEVFHDNGNLCEGRQFEGPLNPVPTGKVRFVTLSRQLASAAADREARAVAQRLVLHGDMRERRGRP